MFPACYDGRRLRRGFSLIEIVAALGIAGVSIIGILSIFPAALETALDSKNETRITLIAQGVFADIKASDFSSVKIKNGPAADDYTTAFSLGTFQDLVFLFDAEGKVVEQATNQAPYVNGSPAHDFIVRVTNNYNTSDYPDMALVEVSVEVPAAAPQAKRKKYTFITLRADS